MDQAPLHIILLEITDTTNANEYVQGHRDWLDEGLNDNVFLLTGSIPGRGGAVLAQGESTEEITERVNRDPFIEHGVVTAEIIEFVPGRFHPLMAALEPESTDEEE